MTEPQQSEIEVKPRSVTDQVVGWALIGLGVVVVPPVVVIVGSVLWGFAGKALHFATGAF